MFDVEWIARVAGKYLWDAVDNAGKNQVSRERKREYDSKAPERRRNAQENARLRRACFDYYYKQVVAELEKSGCSLSGYSRETLEMYVKEKILSNAKTWAESLDKQAKAEYRIFNNRVERDKSVGKIQEFWGSRSDGAYLVYGKTYYQYLKSGKANEMQKLNVLEVASKYKLSEKEVTSLNAIVEFVIASKDECDPVGVSGKIFLPPAEEMKKAAMCHAERCVILSQWLDRKSVFFDGREEEESTISEEAANLCGGGPLEMLRDISVSRIIS